MKLSILIVDLWSIQFWSFDLPNSQFPIYIFQREEIFKFQFSTVKLYLVLLELDTSVINSLPRFKIFNSRLLKLSILIETRSTYQISNFQSTLSNVPKFPNFDFRPSRRRKYPETFYSRLFFLGVPYRVARVPAVVETYRVTAIRGK